MSSFILSIVSFDGGAPAGACTAAAAAAAAARAACCSRNAARPASYTVCVFSRLARLRMVSSLPGGGSGGGSPSSSSPIRGAGARTGAVATVAVAAKVGRRTAER